MRSLLACAALAAGFTIWGCSAPLDPVAPVGPGLEASVPVLAGQGGLFFPLDVGNHWTYARAISIEWLDGADHRPAVYRYTYDIDLTGMGERYGRPYVVWRETYHEGPQDPVLEWLYRQDRGGLYNADPEPDAAAVALLIPEPVVTAARGAGAGVEARRMLEAMPDAVARAMWKGARVRELALHGRILEENGTSGARRPEPQAGEIALLRYPLHTHETWNVRDDPRVVYTVEGHEQIDLPAGRFPAWRIRIDWPDFFGPEDRVHVWYGPDGYLALRMYTVEQGTDELGNPTSLFAYRESDLLSDLSLVR